MCGSSVYISPEVVEGQPYDKVCNIVACMSVGQPYDKVCNSMYVCLKKYDLNLFYACVFKQMCTLADSFFLCVCTCVYAYAYYLS